MNKWRTLEQLQAYIPAALTLAIGTLALVVLARLGSGPTISDGRRLLLQLLGWFVTLIILVSVIVALPLSETLQAQILSLIGVVLTAVIALSSTTFVSNAMAGVMLQVTQPFRPGDFITVNGVFGRVTHRALVHTRIQTDTRDFTTLPNMLLVTHPVNVLHREGTIIQVEVSLGYDVHHKDAEKELLHAASTAGLTEPYVLIYDLLDHAVAYRVAGFASDLKNPLAARSHLREAVLDSLHRADIEITSPAVVAQRQQPGDTRQLPMQDRIQANRAKKPDQPNERVFDQGAEAAAREALRDELKETLAAVTEQEKLIKSLDSEEKPAAQATLERLQQKASWLDEQLNPAD